MTGVFTTNVNISSSRMVKLCTIFRMVVTISRLNTGYITETLKDMFSCSRYTYIAERRSRMTNISHF